MRVSENNAATKGEHGSAKSNKRTNPNNGNAEESSDAEEEEEEKEEERKREGTRQKDTGEQVSRSQ